MSLHGPSVWTGRALQAENEFGEGWSCASVSGLLMEPLRLLAIMDHPRALDLIRDLARRPEGPPDHERAGETFSPSPLSDSHTLAGSQLSLSGST